MRIEVQLVNGEWISVPEGDAGSSQAGRPSAFKAGTPDGHPLRGPGVAHWLEHFWQSRGGIRTVRTLGVQIDTFC